MNDRATKRYLEKTMVRREFLLTGLAALLTLVSGSDVHAQRRRPRRARRPLIKRQRAIIRRRAIRRLRRRGQGLEDQARKAVRQGEVRPLRDVMVAVRRRSNAEVLDVDLHKRPEGWVYALRILTKRGRVRDVFLDAKTLDILSIERRSDHDDGIPLPDPPLRLPRSGPLPKPKPIPLLK